MIELENRFYSRAEISEATGIPANASQFARDVKKKLADEGYVYEWKPRRGRSNPLPHGHSADGTEKTVG